MLDFYNIDDDFNNLRDKEIIVFGASKGGIFVEEKLKKYNISIKYFTDNNKKIWGKTVNNKKVINIQEFINYCNNNDNNASIVIGTMHDKEVERQIRSYNLKNEVIFFNEFIIMEKRIRLHKYLKKDRDLYSQYIKNAWEKVLIEQQQEFVECVMNYEENGEKIYFIYAPSKVGNTSLMSTLEENKIKPYVIWGSLKKFEPIIIDKIKKYTKKIIIGIREPISQNIASMFQSIQEYIDISPYEENDRDAQKIFDKYFVNNVLGMYIKQKSNHDEFIKMFGNALIIQNWFQEELCKYMDVDILKYPFDKLRGYTIIKDKDREILIYKIENVNQLNDVFSEYFNIDKFKLNKSNFSGDKWYQGKYNQFKKEFKMPIEYVERSYNNKYIRHFYTDEEIIEFKNKWKNNIIY